MRYLLVCKGIHLLRAVNLNMGNKGEWVGEVEVFAWWRVVVLCHCVKEVWVIAVLML